MIYLEAWLHHRHFSKGSLTTTLRHHSSSFLFPLYDEHFVHHRDSSCRIYYVESGAIVSALSDLEPKCPVFACVYLCSPIANIDRTGTYQILSSVLVQKCPSCKRYHHT
ncbi:hypothetical protein LY78DRAFT_92240 [Colletotrichum sublineola]|nr:hypothetical protein LY78DRAFT_92240 [Colletotrichum sublineola]